MNSFTFSLTMELRLIRKVRFYCSFLQRSDLHFTTNEKFLDDQPNTIAFCKLNKIELCQNVAVTTLLGSFEETKDGGIHIELRWQLKNNPHKYSISIPLFLIMCFHVIAKLGIKMLFLLQLPYLTMYKSIPCISRPPLLKPKNKFFCGRIFFYLRISIQVCYGYMKKVTTSLDVKFIILLT